MGRFVMKVKWVNPWYRQFSENTQVSFKSLFQLTLRLKITISYDPDVVCMDSSSGFTHVLSFTKKTWTHTCLLTFSRGKLGTMLLKRSEMQFFVVVFSLKPQFWNVILYSVSFCQSNWPVIGAATNVTSRKPLFWDPWFIMVSLVGW